MRKSKMIDDQVQLNLFQPRSLLPRWNELPAEVRNEVGELIAQLFCVYVTDHALESQEKESGNA